MANQNSNEATPIAADKHDELMRISEDVEATQAVLSQLGALFAAIKETQHPSRIRELASLGQYVAQDWANSVDLIRENMVAALTNGQLPHGHVSAGSVQ